LPKRIHNILNFKNFCGLRKKTVVFEQWPQMYTPLLENRGKIVA